MKKSVIALIIASVVALTACDDKTSQKLLETEKKLVQLEASYKKSEENLTTKESELAQLKTQLTELQATAAQAKKAQQAFPALQVETVQFVDKKETLKFEKDPQDEYAPEQSDVELSITGVKTGVDWLDELLRKQLVLSYLPQDRAGEIKGKAMSKEGLNAFFDRYFQQNVASAKQDKIMNEENSRIYYMGQRNNLVMFSKHYYSFSGGAHGMYSTEYLNIDVNKKAVIQLDDLVSPKNQAKLKTILWENYTRERLDENGNYDDSFMAKKDFYIANNFYFSPNGITFVYPVYALGAYAEGEIELSVPFEEISELLNKAYAFGRPSL